MIKIGVSGIAGSGKSLFCGFFKNDNGFVLDLDGVAHDMYSDRESSVYREVIATFQAGVPDLVAADGSINRKALGKYVFSDGQALKKLNDIFYIKFIEYVGALAARCCEKGYRYFVLDAAVLFDSGLDRLMDKTAWVSSPPGLTIARLVEKRGWTREYADGVVSRQIARFAGSAEKAGFIIKNDGDAEKLYLKYQNFLKEINLDEKKSR